MSLFEKIKDKKQNLTEQSRGSGFSNRNRKDITKILSKIGEDPKGTANKVLQSSSKSVTAPKPDEVASAKSLLRNKKKQQNQQIAKNRAEGEALKKDIAKRLSASTTKGDQARSQYSIGDGSTIGTPEGTTTNKTKTVKQSEVSKKAQEFTKEINKKNKNRTFFDPEKAKEARKNLIAKRKEYGIDRKGNISDAGVKRYAQKTKQLSSGSNMPVTPTKKELEIAKRRAVGGDKVTNKSGKVIGTTTGKYGGRLGRARNKNMKTYDQIKRDIDLKDLQKASDAKARNIAKSQELKDLTKKMGEKRLYDKIAFQTKQRSIRPARQFYKGALGTTKNLTKAFGGSAAKVSPALKTGLKAVTKAGPAGAIAGGTALALLNPSVRKTVKKVATGALAAAGIKAFTSKPKLVKRPPSKIGINLSPKA